MHGREFFKDMEMTDLYGKSIIVTGASKGIGEAAARLMAAAGARLVIADCDDAAGDALARDLVRGGAEVTFVKADVADEVDVQRMVKTAVERHGQLDGAFNNAGINCHLKTLHELSLDEFRRVLDVNLVGLFLCMKYQIAEMLGSGGGAIVNSGSTASIKGLPAAPEYNASKHGMLGLMRSAALDYGKVGIRVNTLVIGATDTPMMEAKRPGAARDMERLKTVNPMGRMAAPAEIGAAAAWLLSDAASYVSGALIPVDGASSAV